MAPWTWQAWLTPPKDSTIKAETYYLLLSPWRRNRGISGPPCYAERKIALRFSNVKPKNSIQSNLSSPIQVMVYQETCQTFFKNMFGLQDMPYQLLKDRVGIQITATLCKCNNDIIIALK